MSSAYVGIASRHGLECLWPENEHTELFLCRQAARGWRRKALPFWAVIDDMLAAQVCLEIAAGDLSTALTLLQAHAEDIGPIIPFPPSTNTPERFIRESRL